jgi:hypothetical protein
MPAAVAGGIWQSLPTSSEPRPPSAHSLIARPTRASLASPMGCLAFPRWRARNQQAKVIGAQALAGEEAQHRHSAAAEPAKSKNTTTGKPRFNRAASVASARVEPGSARVGVEPRWRPYPRGRACS